MDSKKGKRDFKKGICLDSSRRRREEASIKLRKDTKTEGIAKRRNIQAESIDAPQEALSQACDDASIQSLFVTLTSGNVDDQTQALRSFRRLLSLEKCPPVAKCIEIGLVPVLVQFLRQSSNFQQQFEAAWALTNIASTDKTRYVVECQAVPELIALLMSPNPDIREQCAWCLGNIAGDGADLREYILSLNALSPLLANITQAASLSILRNCTWTLSNFCRGKPQPDLTSIAPAIPILSQLIQSEYDQEAMVDATWAFSYLSDGDDQRIQAVIDAGLLPSLVKMISSQNTNVVIPALRTIGNIVSGNDKQTQAVINANCLIPLSNLLVHSKKSIRKETCWVLSNIAAGTTEQLNCLFSVPDLLPRVLHQLSIATEWDVRKEAAWVICNIVTSSKRQRLMHLLELGIIQPLCDLLNVGEPKIILIALDAIEVLLKATEGGQRGDSTRCTALIEEAGGTEQLEKLQEHENTKVYERAVQILEKYFPVEEDNDGENVAPVAGENIFTFGISHQSTEIQKLGNAGFTQQQVQPQNFFSF